MRIPVRTLASCLILIQSLLLFAGCGKSDAVRQGSESLASIDLRHQVIAQAALPSGAVSFWTDSNIPASITDSDTGAVELGMKFQSSQTGNVTGIRFYKGPQNTGTHTGHLWSA